MKEAIYVAKKAIEIIDKNHLIFANLAKLYAYIGEHKESEKFYLKSIEINPNDPETLYEYGIQMLSIGDKRKGSKILKKVIEISPNYSIAYFTLSRLLNTNKDKFYIVSCLLIGILAKIYY